MRPNKDKMARERVQVCEISEPNAISQQRIEENQMQLEVRMETGTHALASKTIGYINNSAYAQRNMNELGIKVTATKDAQSTSAQSTVEPTDQSLEDIKDAVGDSKNA